MSIGCPFCTSTNTVITSIPEIYFNHITFTWNKCNNCGLIFILPYLRNTDLQLLYGINYHNEYYFKYTEDYSTQINLLKKYAGNSVLDYGCGDAGLLNQLFKNGYNTTGVEYNPELVKKLTAKFSGIKFLSIAEFWKDTTTKYGIIHLGDVLEHMNQPAELIKNLKEKLTADGLFFIEGPLETNPTLAYFFRKVTTGLKKAINEDSIRVKLPYHVTFSNVANQKILFEKTGLEQIYFNIWEHGWPYIDTIKEISSLWLLLQWIIVKVSIAVSAMIPNWGNRFFYIGKPSKKQPF